MNLITEMLIILRAAELPSIERNDMNCIGPVSWNFQLMLEKIIGTDTKEGLEIFDTHLHMLLHLQRTIEHCGMVRNYGGFNMEQLVNVIKS